jgi:hypothetical protein
MKETEECGSIRSSSRKKRRTKNKVLFLILFYFLIIQFYFLISFLIILFLKIPRLQTQEIFSLEVFFQFKEQLFFDSTLQTILFQVLRTKRVVSYVVQTKEEEGERLCTFMERTAIREGKKRKEDKEMKAAARRFQFCEQTFRKVMVTSQFYADTNSGVPSSSSSSSNLLRPKACLIC